MKRKLSYRKHLNKQTLQEECKDLKIFIKHHTIACLNKFKSVMHFMPKICHINLGGKTPHT